MARNDRPYSRIYWQVTDDPDFAGIYEDDRAFATWTRLLIGADQAWPGSAPLPWGTHKVALRKLVDAGLVVVTGDRYRVKGMDKERQARSEHARTAATARWEQSSEHAGSNAPSNARPMLDETRRDETSKASTSRDDARHRSIDRTASPTHISAILPRVVG